MSFKVHFQVEPSFCFERAIRASVVLRFSAIRGNMHVKCVHVFVLLVA